MKLLLAAVLAPTFVWGVVIYTGRTSRAASHALHVTTHLVVVNVIAHNKNGETVEGLTRRDFTVLDNGKPQQISVFSVERRGARHTPSKPLPPNVFSNRVARDGDVPANVAVILLDGLDTSFSDSVFARNELIRFLRHMPSGERIAVYVLGRKGLSVVQDFTSEPSPLLEAIRGFHANPRRASVSLSGGIDMGTPPISANDAAAQIVADMHDRPRSGRFDYSRMTSPLGAVEAIADRLAGLPGRKSLIWVTDRLPSVGPQFLGNPGAVLSYEGNLSEQERLVRRVFRTLNQADVAVYPVDAHGLVVGPLNKGLYKPGLPPPLWPGEVWTLDMDYWARQTGGRAFYYRNDLSQGIRKALDDTKVSYTLGYYPNDVAWNGDYHHIEVLVDRKGVKARYRRGYFATSGTANTHASAARMLEVAADSPLDTTGLGVTVRLTPIGNPLSHKFKTVVYVDGKGLTFHKGNGHQDVSFMVWVGQYTKQGRLLEKKVKRLSFKLSEANYHAALVGGLGLDIREAVEPGARELRIAVLDTESGKTGSVRIPLNQKLDFDG